MHIFKIIVLVDEDAFSNNSMVLWKIAAEIFHGSQLATGLNDKLTVASQVL